MKLHSISSARAIWLFAANRLTQRGQSWMPIIQELRERYQFVQSPQPANSTSGEKGVKLEQGQFRTTQDETIAIDLGLFSDGLVANTYASTDDSDAFLHDVLMWLHERHGLADYHDIPIKTLYMSELYFTCEKPLVLVKQALVPVCEELAQHDFGHGKHPMEITAFQIGPDPKHTMQRSYAITFERVWHAPFEENRYFSSSPLRTSNHLYFLEKLEEILPVNLSI